MESVGIIPNPERVVACELAVRTARWFSSRGISVRVPRAEADASGLAEFACEQADFVAGLDLVVSIGGDGTMLQSAARVFPQQVPIVGINAGQLGYLNAFEGSDLEGALACLLRGEFQVTNRIVVQCTVHIGDDSAPSSWFGINEVVLEKVAAGRMVRLAVKINGEPFTTYAADGVIVATPTGSTAYSLSARGPIVSPTARVLVLTPVSPHMLFDRSLVLGETESIAFTVTDGRPIGLSIDGRTIAELNSGDRVVCTVAQAPVRLVSPTDLGFHQILKAKFSLPDR